MRCHPQHRPAVERAVGVPRGALAETIALLGCDEDGLADLSIADELSGGAEFPPRAEVEFGQYVLFRFRDKLADAIELFPRRGDRLVAYHFDSALQRLG